jgi:mRNA interferase RelE/StbE
MQKDSWALKIEPVVFKALRRMPQKDREEIERTIKVLVQDPFAGDIKKMIGEKNIWRRRVGSYRVLYAIKDEERLIVVSRVVRRTSQTY